MAELLDASRSVLLDDSERLPESLVLLVQALVSARMALRLERWWRPQGAQAQVLQRAREKSEELPPAQWA